MKTGNRVLPVLLCAVFAVIYTLTYAQHALYVDENDYLSLGNQILEGRYEGGIFHRGPLLPFLISLSYLAGLTVLQIKFLLPLIFGVLFIIATYLAGKGFCKDPIIPVLVILSLAYFWRWAPFLLVDVLMGIFATLSMLYFYRGVEDDRKYLKYSMLFLALAMITKATSMLLLVAFPVYLLARRRLGILKTGEFGRGLLAFLLIFLSVAFLVYLSSGTTGIELKSQVGDYVRYQSFYFIRFAIIPWTLLFLYGAYRAVRSRDRGGIFALTMFLTVFIIFNLISWKETRFLIFVFPMFAVLVENGARKLRKTPKYIIMALFFALAFAESMLLLNTVSYVTWGSDLLAGELAGLDAGSVIATDSSILFDRSLEGRIIGFPEEFSRQWAEENGVDYMVLSIYGEITRNPDMGYYKPRIGFIDAPFMGEEAAKNILTWWPDYRFSSQLYQVVNSEYSVFKKITYDGQDVFIIYRVAG